MRWTARLVYPSGSPTAGVWPERRRVRVDPDPSANAAPAWMRRLELATVASAPVESPPCAALAEAEAGPARLDPRDVPPAASDPAPAWLPREVPQGATASVFFGVAAAAAPTFGLTAIVEAVVTITTGVATVIAAVAIAAARRGVRNREMLPVAMTTTITADRRLIGAQSSNPCAETVPRCCFRIDFRLICRPRSARRWARWRWGGPVRR